MIIRLSNGAFVINHRQKDFMEETEAVLQHGGHYSCESDSRIAKNTYHSA